MMDFKEWFPYLKYPLVLVGFVFVVLAWRNKKDASGYLALGLAIIAFALGLEYVMARGAAQASAGVVGQGITTGENR